ncbi:hypothetical protein [Brevibacillus borstelensis]|uniref:hypothetical protein n=1 Tax=Brevibacillus borstelensis TaxID=45462 RepID=UPI0030C56D77
MSSNDLQKDVVYTDKHGRFRKIIGFFNGLGGDRRVRYEKGYVQNDGKWRFFDSGSCSRKSFARWAKEKL